METEPKNKTLIDPLVDGNVSETEDHMALPSDKYTNITETATYINSLTREEIDELTKKIDIRKLGSIFTNIKYQVPDDINLKDKEDVVNSISYGDSKFNMSRMGVATESGKVSGQLALYKLKRYLAIGEPIQVPLWHSGFWINLRPPSQAEIINMEIAITENEIRLGRDTNATIYSNYAVVINRIVTDFIKDHIDTTSINCPVDKAIELIRLNDFYPLVLGLISSMYPKGVKITKFCKNVSTVINDNIKCTYEIQGTLDPKKLLFVDKSILNDELLNHMSNRLENTMSLDSVKEYQTKIKSSLDKEITLNFMEKDIILKLSQPYLTDYIVSGERWVNKIIKSTEQLFTDKTTVEEKNNLISKMAVNSSFGKYSTFIKAIKFDDSIIEDEETISEILTEITVTTESFVNYVKAMENFITESSISIVGTPNYTCPKCLEEQNTTEGRFKEILPLNVVNSFFDLSAFRLTKQSLELQFLG